MTIHNLKISPEYFSDILYGKKTFEIRKNDRDYKVGDILNLNEYENGYTGSNVSVTVSYILDDPNYVIPGYITMSIEPINKEKEEQHDQ